MSSQKIKFGDKEVNKKEFCSYKESIFLRFCRFKQNNWFE